MVTHGGNIVSVISSIASGWGFSKIELDKAEEELKDEPLEYIFSRLVAIIRTFGFSSIYVLIDRIDEVQDLSNDAKLSFRFIEPLITNLHLLETNHCAFKFFLWDQTEDSLSTSAFRRDRVPVYTLNWSQGELEDMLSRRVQAFSDGKISSINDMLASDVKLDLHKLVCLLSKGSPRDVIRLVGRVVDEHTRVEDSSHPIDLKSIEAAIKKFSRERSFELYGGRIEELSKIGMISFTIGDLANDVFRISHQAARNKIQNFLNVGAALKSGEIENPGNRPLHQYSLGDPRLAFFVLSSDSVKNILLYNCFVCPRCATLLVREGEEVSCDNCSLEFASNASESLWTKCLRTTEAVAR